ncbi:hypothetical protein XELAEV_18027291mg [Xenopus laevis]|uniref:Uncharacterized protein n=1 Tax=Xenopus laevis TaxID=8355 RepID=A0A974HJM6_XENLA|nr:hypothetical protein XELAEV_18027291mg [Xenopus laevis]
MYKTINKIFHRAEIWQYAIEISGKCNFFPGNIHCDSLQMKGKLQHQAWQHNAPVEAHFCNNTHSIKDLRVTALKGNFKTQQEQKEWELKLIRKFNTQECGLNRDRSFMSRYDFN